MDVTRLKCWPALQALGFKRRATKFKGLTTGIGAVLTLEDGSEIEILAMQLFPGVSFWGHIIPTKTYHILADVHNVLARARFEGKLAHAYPGFQETVEGDNWKQILKDGQWVVRAQINGEDVAERISSKKQAELYYEFLSI